MDFKDIDNTLMSNFDKTLLSTDNINPKMLYLAEMTRSRLNPSKKQHTIDKYFKNNSRR
jgi:hypothetical protein